jgi:UDP-N-acetylmuramoyl-L-alanyl-D-glutamate--2,6-diaminopimelate ligase
LKLSDLLRGVDVGSIEGDASVEITGVTPDSRLASPGALFVAIPGTQRDGLAFAAQALEKGAAAIVANATPPGSTVPVVVVGDPREALSLIAANFHGRPADRLSLIGVTGTSGKTTTTRMVEAILDAGEEPAGLIGTIEYRAGDERLVADRTTPDATVLQEWFAKMVTAGVRHAVMEVSSHALALKRTYGVRFAGAVFTNLTREHFDFHKDFEDYFSAKKILFTQIDRSRRTAVVNIDDPWGRRLAGELGAAAMTFGRAPEADIRPAEGFGIGVDGLRGELETPAGRVRVDSRLLGLPNLYNWMGAVGAALVVGIPIHQIEQGVSRLQSVRGRFERVGDGRPTVIVDYAHKPDALEKLLAAVREIAGERRIVVVFGCGGDRDRGKRPEMGGIASRLADRVVITSDNPRSEEPEAIVDEIAAGIEGVAYEKIVDRREAIARTIAQAADDDVVVIAGKGHETYQVVGDRVVHFDDREEAEVALKNRAKK